MRAVRRWRDRKSIENSLSLGCCLCDLRWARAVHHLSQIKPNSSPNFSIVRYSLHTQLQSSHHTDWGHEERHGGKRGLADPTEVLTVHHALLLFCEF